MTTAIPMTPEVRGRVRVEQGAKRIRGFVGGELVVETFKPLLVWEKPQYPTYYFPLDDVRAELLTSEGRTSHSPSRGDAEVMTLAAGGVSRSGAALRYDRSPFESLWETAASSGTPSTHGSRRTSRSSPTREIRTRGSTSSQARATYASRRTESSLPSRTSRRFSSRRGSPSGTTSRRRTSGWIC